VLHAEVGGGTLFLISEKEVEDHHLPRALDVFHCGRVHVIPPDSYEGLLCSFARQHGEDFGMGMIQTIDFESKTAKILSDAVPPAPVRILKIGGMRIDTAGRELGEVRPWQV
jgi:polynucleotide 5'-kinase involved in rRNA processing